MDIVKVWEVIQVFPRYSWHEKVVLVVGGALSIYVLYLLTIGRPPLILYRLVMSPSHYATATGSLTPEGYMRVGVELYNLSKPAAEIHNIQGEVWLAAPKVVEATKAPDRVINDVMYYDFDQPLLHKNTGVVPLVRWLIIPPQSHQKFFIGYRVVSSETEWKGGGWQIVNDNGQLRIIDAEG